jgi:colanic acid/amylovoran biosynthesis glycosyltransferase
MKNKPKIVIVTWLFPKISETFVLNQITFLIDRGFDVKIFALKDARKDTPKEDSEPENIVHPAVIKYKLINKTTYGSIPTISSLLKRAIKDKQIDIIYFQFSDLASEILRNKKFEVPIITTIHDLPKIIPESYKILFEKFKIAFEKATIIIVISELAKKDLLDLGCPSQKIIVHPMGVDPKLFSFQSKKDHKKGIDLAVIGRFVPKKGLDVSIKAFFLIKNKYPNLNIRLNIVGDGLLRPELQNLVINLNLQESVKFWGKLNQLEVKKILKKTDILLCSSVTDIAGKREGLPVVLIEASLSGIPIVATNHASISEIALINRSIVIVTEGSVNSFANGIERIINNYDFYVKLSRDDYKKVKEKYSIQKLGEKLIDIFQRAIETNLLEKALKNFTVNLKNSFGKKIACAFVVGSIARYEETNKFSDIDIAIIIHSNNIRYDDLTKIKNCLKKLYHATNKLITAQIFNESDFSQLLSPTLLKGYLIDGKVLIGHSFLEKIKMPTLKKLELNILKRMFFQRYLIRQQISSDFTSLDLHYRLAKTAMFLVKYSIWIKERRYITKREDIFKYWEKIERGGIILNKIKRIIYNKRDSLITNADDEKIVNFIENICNKAFEVLKNRYGTINIESF